MAASAQRLVLVRSTLWMLCASALWGLLPVVARHELGLEATGYGFLVTCVGRGAVGGRIALPWLRARWPTNRLLMAAIVTLPDAAGAGLGALFAAGLCDAGARRRGLDDVQPELSDRGADERAAAHGRARAIATYLLTFQGGQAIGAALWGTIAHQRGRSAPLTLAAIGTASACWRR